MRPYSCHFPITSIYYLAVKNTLILLFFVLCFQAHIQAQALEVGAWGGTSVYFGDLNTNYSFREAKPAAGAFIRYNLNSRLAIKGGGSYGRVAFADALSENYFQKMRNLSFQSDIIEGTAQFEFNFLPITHGSPNEFFAPYLFVGGTIYHFNPKTEFQGQMVSLQPLGTEGQHRNDEYNLTQPAVAFGGGFKLDLNPNISFNLEASTRFLFTDYLDDVSTTYADPEDLENQRSPLAVLLADRSWEVNEYPIGRTGSQRGDSKANDKYVFIGAGFTYNFLGIKCPWE